MDKTLELFAGRSRVRILGRGKCSLKMIMAVDARVNHQSYLFTVSVTAEPHREKLLGPVID